MATRQPQRHRGHGEQGKWLRVSVVAATLSAVAMMIFQASRAAGVNEEQLWLHRNLGKAYYENPTMLPQAVEEFRKALDLSPDSPRERLNYGLALLRAGHTEEGIAELEKVQRQDPKLPHTWFNLGIAYKKVNRLDRAMEQLQGVLRLVPADPISHYNLGLIYKLREQTDLALKEFEETVRLDPDLVAPRFQLFNTYRENDRKEEAERALDLFRAAKQRKSDPDDTEDMEWNVYAEVYDPTDAAAEPVPAPGRLRFEDRALPGKADAKSAGLATLHSGGGDRLDLLVWSAAGVRLYLGGDQAAVDSGLEAVRGAVFIAPGDFDNDGLPDLCVVTSEGASLWRNEQGKFTRQGGALAKGSFRKAVWLDYDHDYDLDLVLLGDGAALLRNQGPAGFADHTRDFPFVPGRALDAAVFNLISDNKQMDLLVSYEDREGTIYRDRLLGRYEALPLPGLPKGATSLRQLDIDQNGWMDLAFHSGRDVAFLSNREGVLGAGPAVEASAPVQWADLENRAAADLITGGAVVRNLGEGKFEAKSSYQFAAAGVAWAAGDFNLDGRIDLASIASDGGVHVYLNRTASRNGWVGVRLAGVKNLKVPYGTEVEVKSGPLYQKQMFEGGTLVFGLRSRERIDTVRINWANGLVQNQPKEQPGRYVAVKEAPRLSGSCPMIFTWNGRRFEFLTDVLGVAPLGASAGDGKFFSTDHDEYVQIPGESLVERGGRYEIRITEELSEVSYLDQVRLIAVDHPGEVEVYSNDKWKSPPYPEFRLFGVRERVYPRAARDHWGRDVLSRLASRDRVYAGGFRRDHAGVAETHWLELDFGRDARAGRPVLVLNGWVDWADGSVFLSQAQQGRPLTPPCLQVKDAGGNWRTVIEDMGMPSGKTKTIAVDLAGKFLSASREVRIVTNMCVYWDEVFLGEDSTAPQARLVPVAGRTADLHFRGFSRVRIHPERKQPERFEYHEVRLVSQWIPTPGLYTRYGPVEELLAEVDDRFVIMGPGDELSLSFDAGGLPPLSAGWKRDFLLFVDGWEKDRDANTAWSQTVEPLPFHGMSSYPYPEAESYPQDPFHRDYQRRYLKRGQPDLPHFRGRKKWGRSG